MSTKIEWCDDSWNPVTGCTKISRGCKNCYAERMSKRLAGRFGYPKDNPFQITFHPDRLQEPLKWRKARRIFVCSMSDLFHPVVGWNWQYKIFETMFVNFQHTYLILTKRPERIMRIIENIHFHLGRNYGLIETDVYPFPLKNVWLGVSVEDQKTYDERVSALIQIPAAKRWVSYEPALEKVYMMTTEIDWLVMGAETGPGARPFDIEWARDTREQCEFGGIPFFFKSAGKQKTPDDLKIREYPK